MPSIPLGVDSFLENNNNSIGRRHGVTSRDFHFATEAEGMAVSTSFAAATSRPHDGQPDQHTSDQSDDNNCFDEEQRSERLEVIPPVRSPPSVKAAVATALEVSQGMEGRRAAKATCKATGGIIRENKKSKDDNLDNKNPSSSSPRRHPARNNVSPVVSKAAEYIGVTYSRARNQWQARVCIQHKQQYCGRYRLAADAAKAYDDTIKKLGLAREANFSSDEEYQIARREEAHKFKVEAQRERGMMAAARAAAGLDNALPSFAPASVSAVDANLAGRSSCAVSHATFGTKRELEGEFREAKTPPAAKKSKNDQKVQ
jgi:hypothetical protein